MKVGIIGIGVVGGAVKIGMEKLGHAVSFYDIQYPETSIQSVLGTDLAFICVPTPASETDGTCDVSIVDKTLAELSANDFKGLAVIKSTVVPGTTDTFQKKYPGLRIAFCPEFLRERSAISDFVENHDVCVIGAYDDTSFELIRDAHGQLPEHVFRLTPLEAEFAKYFSNIFNALRIIFANEFYEACRATGADYTKIKNAMTHRKTISDIYLECNENFRGFGGVCLPKDTQAFAAFVKSLGLDLKLFEMIVEENKKFKRTVYDGMREA